jgi:hypothetical protein
MSRCTITEIPGPTRRVFTPRYDEEDYVEQYGSAEQDEEEEQSNILVQRAGPGVIIPTLGPPALGTHHTYTENRVPVPPARGGGPRPGMSRGSNSQHREFWVVGLISLLFVLRVMN